MINVEDFDFDADWIQDFIEYANVQLKVHQTKDIDQILHILRGYRYNIDEEFPDEVILFLLSGFIDKEED